MERWQKTTLPAKKWLKCWLVRFCGMCCFVGGVSFFLCGGGQNKFPSNCTALSTEYQSSQSFFCNYFNSLLSCQCVKLLVLHTCLQRWRYEIVGDCGLLSYPVTPNFDARGAFCITT